MTETETGQESIFSEHAHSHALTVATRLGQRGTAGKAILEGMLSGRLGELIDPALEVAMETGQPIGTVLARCFAAEGTDELAEWLALKLSEDPHRIVWPLHELGLLATLRFLDIFRARTPSPGLRELAVLAALVHNAGWRLLVLGRAAEALPLLEEALSLYAELGPETAAQRSQCLGSCGEALTRLGRLSEALARTEEAVAASRSEVDVAGAERLAEANLSLAGQLINLCGCLADVDRHGDALAAIDQAVATYRQHRHGGGQTQAFARALLCRGNELHHLGRYREAAETLEEAIALSRELDSDRTTAFEPDLALALANLSLLYGQLGRVAESKQALHEAIRRYRRLENRHPESFRAALAWSLSLLSSSSRQVSGELSSRTAREEAIDHYRRLASLQKGIYDSPLARSLFDLSESLFAEGDLRAALAAIDEAVARLRRLPFDRRNLAWSLLLRGRIRGALGHRRKALADTQEAVALFRQRSEQQAAFFSVDLASALHLLGIRHHELGQFKAAIEVTREAVGIYRGLGVSEPGVLDEDLASCLNSLSHHLYEAGELEESVAALRESIDLHRRLLDRSAGAALGLAAALTFLAARLGELGLAAEALPAAEEAVDLYRGEQGPPEELSAALLSLGSILLDLQRPVEAMPWLEESVSLRTRLAASRPGIHDVDLASSLVSLGKAWSDQGRYEEALRASRRGARLLRRAVKRGDDFLRPRLAVTLSNQAHQLRELGRPQPALTSAAEAVKLLTPFFREQPERYLQWTTLAVGHYLGAAEDAGEEPDLELVAAVATVFASAAGLRHSDEPLG